MLTLPPAPHRAALLDALESLVGEAGSYRLMLPPVPPLQLSSVLESRGPAHLATAMFRAAGMPEPEVVVMGGSGAATAFITKGKSVVRMGADLAPSAAVASVARAAAAVWRQASDLPPAAREEDEVATSVYLTLAAAEAAAAHDLGERDRASALVFLLAAQSLARDDAPHTAAVARELAEPLDALYEDALRLLALRGEELRTRFRVDRSNLPFTPTPAVLIGTPLTDDPAPPAPPIAVASVDEAYQRLEAQPCPCGGRWRVAERRASADDPSMVRFAVVCRVCLKWRGVTWQVGER